MAKMLTKKQRKFVDEYADTGNGVQSALKAYDTESYGTAGVIAVENLEKPKIVAALKELGFDSQNAKRVVGEILNDTSVEPQHRLKASELVFKVTGDFAPEKTAAINLNIEAQSGDINTDELVKEAESLLKSRKLYGDSK